MVALVVYDALLRQRDLEEQKDTLEPLRRDIDVVDHQLIQLLARRGEISRKIGRHKAEKGLRIKDGRRETELMRERLGWGTDLGVDRALIRDLFRLILKESKEIQKR
jgi:chorismate mutase